MRHSFKATVYIRSQRLSSTTGKPYWGFSVVKMGQGRKPTGSFYLRHVNDNGKQEWVAAGHTFAEATALRDKLLAHKHATKQGLTVEQAEDLENVGRVSVKEAAAKFLKAKEHTAKRTVAAYRLALDCFIESLPSRVRFMDEVTEPTVRNYVDAMSTAGLSPKTIKNRVLVVSFLLKHQGSKVKTNWKELPEVEEQPVKVFEQNELRKVFQAMNDKEHSVFSFFLGSGCREQEVSHAEWSDLDLQHRIFTVSAKPEWGFAPKSHEARQIPLPEELVTMLKARKKHSDTKLIFPNRDKRPNGHFLRILKRVALRAGLNCGHCTGTTSKLTGKDKDKIITKYHQRPNGSDALEAKLNGGKKLSCKDNPVCEQWYLHRFRKTFATKMHHNGMRLIDLQKILGHRSLKTTERYLAPSDMKTAHIREISDKAFSF
jgi:integrase/recombinase XerD